MSKKSKKIDCPFFDDNCKYYRKREKIADNAYDYCQAREKYSCPHCKDDFLE